MPFFPGKPSNELNPEPMRHMACTAPYAVVPSDGVDLPVKPYGIYVGTGGDVRLQGVEGTGDVTYKNLQDGAYIAVQAKRVFATGTTASNLIAEA